MFSSKASISDGIGVHKWIQYGQLACFGTHYDCWKVYKGFRATYAPLQMTSISRKALCISAGHHDPDDPDPKLCIFFLLPFWTHFLDSHRTYHIFWVLRYVWLRNIFFMNYFWDFALSVQQRWLLLADLTAAKKMLVNRWNPPHTMDRRSWTVYLLDIISMELSSSRIHGSNVKTVNSWHSAFNAVSSFIKYL